MVGILLPMLLFADDIVFLATSRLVMQRLLDGLSSFCEANGLIVSTDKTQWLLGGAVPVGFEAGELCYQGVALVRI